MVIRAKIDNRLPNGSFKTCPDARCLLCKHSTKTRTVLKASPRVAPNRYLATRLAAQTTGSISSFAKFAQSNALVKQWPPAEGSTIYALHKDQTIQGAR